MQPIRRALISVFDKTGIIEFAKDLVACGVEIISSGGTYSALQKEKVRATPLNEITGYPEILGGRVKTLHPQIHGGILAVRDDELHQQQMAENQIKTIDLVVVNLYPFQETMLTANATNLDVIEMIDIGGPALIRAAAKNYRFVTVVVNPKDYASVPNEVNTMGQTSETLRQHLAAKAFNHTAAYDSIVAGYFNELTGEWFPDQLTRSFIKGQELRYGENPHQKAAFYQDPLRIGRNTPQLEQLQGKELSFNNIQDAYAAIEIISEFKTPVAVAVKHSNPCGVGVGDTVAEAFEKVYLSDPVSIFGGIIAMNTEVDLETAQRMSNLFLEVVIAPSFQSSALELFSKKKNLRVLAWHDHKDRNGKPFYKMQSVREGLLIQEVDQGMIQRTDCRVVTHRTPTEAEWEQLLFAWAVVKGVKSNAIVVVKDMMTVGIGAGQMNRVGAAEIAIRQAGIKAKGSVMSSDAFLPMNDTVKLAAAAGITAIIQPGGSIRDQDSIDEANQHNIAMIFTGMRHFKH